MFVGALELRPSPSIGQACQWPLRVLYPVAHIKRLRSNFAVTISRHFATASKVGCAHSQLRRIISSDDDFGVVFFRADGLHGYRIPSKHAFYSENKLPPNAGLRPRREYFAPGRFNVGSHASLSIIQGVTHEPFAAVSLRITSRCFTSKFRR